MSVSIRLRQDSAELWGERNPVLHQGELGVDTSNMKMKLGDGFTRWNSLPYVGDLDEVRTEYGNQTDFNETFEQSTQ
jgi:hypothetical protein